MKRRSFLAALFAAPAIPLATKVEADRAKASVDVCERVESDEKLAETLQTIAADDLEYPFIFENGELRVNENFVRKSADGKMMLCLDRGYIEFT